MAAHFRLLCLLKVFYQLKYIAAFQVCFVVIGWPEVPGFYDLNAGLLFIYFK